MSRVKSNCHARFGCQLGLMSEPATDFIFAHVVSQGNPSDPSSVLPLLNKVGEAIQRIRTAPWCRVYSVAGDLGVNDISVHQALHTRDVTIRMPKTI